MNRKTTDTWLRLAVTSIAILAMIGIGNQPASASHGSGAEAFEDHAQPEAICPSGGQCFADVISSSPFYDFINRIYEQDLVSGYACGGQGEPCDGESRPYYRPGAGVTRQQMAKFIDNARRLPELHIEADSSTAPVYVRNNAWRAIDAYSNSGDAVFGQSTGGAGVVGMSSTNVGIYGSSTSAVGIYGVSDSSFGVKGGSSSNTGVVGISGSGEGVKGTSDSNTGVYGGSNSGTGVVGSGGDKGVSGISVAGIGVYGFALAAQGGRAGYFLGDVVVTGNCCAAAAGNFKMDHPLDPTNQYLYHAAVESPDMMNIYNGNVTTDANGEAIVQLPDYFEALNRDFRYQLTVMGQFAQAIVASEIKGNAFTIKTDSAFVKVSWQVTGIRQDPYANAHRSPIEEEKPAAEKGKYLYPIEWGQPASMGINDESLQSVTSR